MNELDKKMQDAGMIPITAIMAGVPTDKWHVHTGVTDIESFGKWLDMKTEEMLRLKVRIELSEEKENHELYEWALAHSAALHAVRCNFKAAVGER